MQTHLIGSLGLLILTKLMLVLSGCDAQDPSFTVEETSKEALQGSSSLDAEAVFAEGDGLAQQDDEIVVIKDNGLSHAEGGTLPPSLEGSIGNGGAGGNGGNGGGGGSDPDVIGGGTTGGGTTGGGTTIEDQLTVAALTGSYQAGTVKNGEKTFSIDALLEESRYVMSAELMDAAQSFNQINRTTLTEMFKQGTEAKDAADSFMQNAYNGVLDVLVVIDNSGSMSQEQANLSTKLAPLLSEVDGSDWQIGVVTTDNGCLRDLIKKGDANANADFAAAVNAGISGSGNEQGIRYAVEGLTDGCQAQSWLRPNSTVAVLIVSDEDNCSTNGAGCGSNPWNSESYLMNHLASIRVPGANARVYGIFWHPSQDSNACSTGAYQATQYAKIVADTKGTWGSICDADYTSTLSQISKDISVILKTQFVLSHIPEPNTIEVKVDGQVMATGYAVSGNVITFNSAPMEGSTVSITYKYGYQPILKEFVLSTSAVSYNMDVQVNGVSTTAFTFNSGSNSIEFPDYPAENADIKVTFKKNEPLLKDFTINSDLIENSVSVKVNGKALIASEFSYDSAAKKVSLATAPYDGSTILVSFKSIGSKTLNYPYAWGEAQQAIEVYDLDTKAPIAASYSNGDVLIDNGEFEYGRRFAVKDPNASGITDYTVKLPVAPLASTLVVKFQNGECRPPDKVKIVGLAIDLEECEFGSSVDNGNITYSYVSSIQNTFELDPSFFEMEHKAEIWRVWIDGQLITDYTVDGNKVTINAKLNYLNKVEIKVSLLKAI